MEWSATTIEGDDSRSVRYQLHASTGLMTWRDVLHAWSGSDNFADYFTGLLAGSAFDAFRWETPRLDEAGLEDAFEFVLVQSNELRGHADSSAFEEHFTPNDPVVVFGNLGGDCVLVVPRPLAEWDDFGHLAAFLRSGSQKQIRCLWRETSAAVLKRVRTGPLWLSSAGAGVPWLHIRIDDRPKYYTYAPYRNAS